MQMKTDLKLPAVHPGSARKAVDESHHSAKKLILKTRRSGHGA